MRTNSIFRTLFCGLLLGTTAYAQTISSLGAQIKAPGGNDGTIRTQFHALVSTQMAGSAAARQQLETDLLAEVGKTADWQVKSFFMSELGGVAQQSATVTAMAALLNDANLANFAITVLLGMALDPKNSALNSSIQSAVRTKLAGATGANQIALIRAAGSLRDKMAVDQFLPLAGNPNPVLKFAALRGLAMTGDPKGKAPLAAALTLTDPYEKSLAINLNLLYAKSLAGAGQKPEAMAVATAVRDLPGRGICEHYVIAANQVLQEIPTITRLNGGRESMDMKPPMHSFINPGTGKLHIALSGQGPFSVKVSDLLGKPVWQSDFRHPQEIEIERKLKGTFLIEVKSEKSVLAEKMIIH